MKVVILAGGKGTRMGDLVSDLPKPMVLLAGKPIMEHQIDLAQRYGLEEFIVLTGYKADVLEGYFGDGAAWGVHITYRREDYPLGTAGAVKELEGELDEPFFVFYGDVLMDVHLPMFAEFHRAHGAAATIAVHPNDHPFDSDLVQLDEEDRVIAIHSKPHDPDVPRRNIVSAALYVMSPRALEHIGRGQPSDFGRDVFPRLLTSGETIQAYQTREYIKDVGTIQRLGEVETDLVAGRPFRLNQENSVGAIFLDRDGVLNAPVEPLRSADQFRLLPGVASAVATINASERLAVVVTNQPLIAKGFASESDVESIHGEMEGLLSEEGSYLDRIYYCPHHPETGHVGERPELKVPCHCRKPGTGMIDLAARELNIDLSDSFMIGDRTVDVQAGIHAGIGTILVGTGCAGKDLTYDCDPDFYFCDLGAATAFVEGDLSFLMAHAEKVVAELDLVGGGRVIAIGGLSRTGKTSLAGAISLALRRRGITAKRMNLDDWLLASEDRTEEMTVRGRYDYEKIRSSLRRVLLGERVDFTRYDPLTRTHSGGLRSIEREERDILIIDGVVSLDVSDVRAAATLRIYTEVDEAVRWRRLRDFYTRKGLSPQETDVLLHQRRHDEEPIVTASREFANLTINMGTPV